MAIACRAQHLTPAEALNAITINAAHAIGLGHQVGSLEVGKQADLLVLNAPDYRQLTYWLGRNLVQQVVKRGHVIVVQ
jgi:imidazolonepropionase